MKKLIAALAIVLYLSTSALAGRVVMNFSDSRGGTGYTSTNDTSWPKLLDNQRADFTVCNKYLNGRTTASGLTQIDQAIVECQVQGTVTDVTILLGVASMLSGISADLAADQIRAIAAKVVQAGAVPWIILEPPGPLAWGGYSYMNAMQYTKDIIDSLAVKNVVGPWYPDIDVRDALHKNIMVNGVMQPGYWFKKVNLDPNSCSSDDLHPTKLECRQQIFADTVSTSIP